MHNLNHYQLKNLQKFLRKIFFKLLINILLYQCLFLLDFFLCQIRKTKSKTISKESIKFSNMLTNWKKIITSNFIHMPRKFYMTLTKMSLWRMQKMISKNKIPQLDSKRCCNKIIINDFLWLIVAETWTFKVFQVSTTKAKY